MDRKYKSFNLFSSLSRGALAIALLCVVAGTLKAQRKEHPSLIQPAHGEVIDKWLAQSPRRAKLRLATDKDCRNKDGLAAERKENRSYQPYYAWEISIVFPYFFAAVAERTFGTILNANGENPKVIQELMRHANLKVTMDTYVQAVTDEKREAQNKLVKMILPGIQRAVI